MLIDFTVENFRSIKEPVTLSAIATKQKKLTASDKRKYVKPDNEIAPPYNVEGWDLELLPVLGIFGANASGKSNVLHALNIFLRFMYRGVKAEAREPEDNIWDTSLPFRLDTKSAETPTRFQCRLFLSETLFNYEVTLTRQRIVEEKLEYAPPSTQRDRLLFLRQWNEDEQAYSWKNGPDFAGPQKQLETRLYEKHPFLDLLLTSLDIPMLQPIKTWLGTRMPGLGLGESGLNRLLVTVMGASDPQYMAKISEIVRQFDTGITELKPLTVSPYPSIPLPSSLPPPILVVNGYDSYEEVGRLKWKLLSRHEAKEGSFWLDFSEESNGTQELLSLAYRIIQAIETGTILLQDELDASLHPHITRAIVQMFQSPKTNPKRAQLIFTSHDNTLQRNHLLRRDQIWFTEKREDGSTDLYSLSDFKERNDLAIDRAYLSGRFGAVPFLPDEDELAEVLARGEK